MKPLEIIVNSLFCVCFFLHVFIQFGLSGLHIQGSSYSPLNSCNLRLSSEVMRRRFMNARFSETLGLLLWHCHAMVSSHQVFFFHAIERKKNITYLSVNLSWRQAKFEVIKSPFIFRRQLFDPHFFQNCNNFQYNFSWHIENHHILKDIRIVLLWC